MIEENVFVEELTLKIEESLPKAKEADSSPQTAKKLVDKPPKVRKTKSTRPTSKEITRIDLSALIDLDLKEAGYWFNCAAFIVSYSLVITFSMNAIWGFGTGSGSSQHGMVTFFLKFSIKENDC